MNTKDKLIKKCKQVADLLIQKNEAYGDSALNPAGIFSKLKASEALKIRLDDKLKRIQNVGVSDETEDTLMDCAGYMILLMIALDNESNDIQERLRKEGTTSHTAKDGTEEDTVGEVWFSDSTGP
jgi:hypothetical protein